MTTAMRITATKRVRMDSICGRARGPPGAARSLSGPAWQTAVAAGRFAAFLRAPAA